MPSAHYGAQRLSPKAPGAQVPRCPAPIRIPKALLSCAFSRPPRAQSRSAGGAASAARCVISASTVPYKCTCRAQAGRTEEQRSARIEQRCSVNPLRQHAASITWRKVQKSRQHASLRDAGYSPPPGPVIPANRSSTTDRAPAAHAAGVSTRDAVCARAVLPFRAHETAGACGVFRCSVLR